MCNAISFIQRGIEAFTEGFARFVRKKSFLKLLLGYSATTLYYIFTHIIPMGVYININR
ncbi:hypothetical protein EPHNCH_0191 [Anaplasma phagocytophilum str. NCH-1]|uniref:Uncharacterized protein n=1 Tax=Anaplasma phagocytophilum str. NCH-1 TaxID=1359161 RepID=A0A0F3NKE4_ANAPH|nr:hypothetical protein APHWEB_0534 [Anaplasma phagocytophilum str. Webster]KJV68533.1 hypothetical protein EPHNCH_0191 [Anaplasma phagocytophilum str. NCH-1]KJV82252.1 hypothetical protein APHHGE2_0208 [Anaplasma phagocytophilum str. HGE2]KJV86383.1 hypothetical protein APHNYW_1526 [Anaplasma phagocytophilum str. ApNYW]